MSNKFTDRHKSWNRKKSFAKAYAIESKSKHRIFLIICEGNESEYFKSIPAPNAEVKALGLGRSKTALVKKAKEIAQREESHGREVWCVFDYDYQGDEKNQKQDFNQAIITATSSKFHVAWSNDCIELWFVLHYKEIRQRLTRYQYYKMLEDIWKIRNYAQEGKSSGFSKLIYHRLQNDPQSSEKQAIVRATRLCQEFAESPYADRNPCTTVHELVLRLKNDSQ